MCCICLEGFPELHRGIRCATPTRPCGCNRGLFSRPDCGPAQCGLRGGGYGSGSAYHPPNLVALVSISAGKELVVRACCWASRGITHGVFDAAARAAVGFSGMGRKRCFEIFNEYRRSDLARAGSSCAPSLCSPRLGKLRQIALCARQMSTPHRQRHSPSLWFEACQQRIDVDEELEDQMTRTCYPVPCEIHPGPGRPGTTIGRCCGVCRAG